MSSLKEVTKLITKKGKDKGNIEIRVSVEEIENGFIIVKNKEWRDPKDGYKYETKKWFSDTDPLEIKTDGKTLADIFK